MIITNTITITVAQYYDCDDARDPDDHDGHHYFHYYYYYFEYNNYYYVTNGHRRDDHDMTITMGGTMHIAMPLPLTTPILFSFDPWAPSEPTLRRRRWIV